MIDLDAWYLKTEFTIQIYYLNKYCLHYSVGQLDRSVHLSLSKF